MTDEAAESRGPATTEDTGPSQGAPAPSPTAAPTAAAGATAPDGTAPTGGDAPPAAPPPGGSPPPPGGSGPPPGSYPPPGSFPPPGGPDGPPPGFGFPWRQGVVRPRHGRYVAGVCAAIGRATNTDPVLWRVLLAVLGFFGGIGILVYLAAWLVLPAEGDSASPVEAMLGRGRSSTSPITVLVLGVLVAVMFGFIVTDTFRAVLLGAAVLVGGALLLNRNANAPQRAAGTTPGEEPTAAAPTAPYPPAAHPPTGPYPPVADPPTAPYPPVAEPPTVPFPTAAPASTTPDAGPEPPTAPLPPMPPPAAPASPLAAPSGGYRPPFAPRGPYGGSAGYGQPGPYGGPGPYPPGWSPAMPPPLPPPPPRRPKPPRERSALGAATFSLIFVAVGLVAVLDLTGAVPVWPSTYFAAALVTIALGLLVGAWFGRARWLIALGMVAAVALGISTTAESFSGARPTGSVVWRPADVSAIADRYETSVGEATLDLTGVDFTDQDVQVHVKLALGDLKVLLPAEVDVRSRLELGAGSAQIFAERWEGFGQPPREIVDNGIDGPGGGTLRLILNVKAGNVEVHR